MLPKTLIFRISKFLFYLPLDPIDSSRMVYLILTLVANNLVF